MRQFSIRALREKRIRRLERAIDALGVPAAITVDHGTAFTSKALADWAWQRGIKLDFNRPGKPNEIAHIESFNTRLRDECLNVDQSTSMGNAQRKVGRTAAGLQSHATPPKRVVWH